MVKSGTGNLNNPEKALYNKVYNQTTTGLSDILKTKSNNSKSSKSNSNKYNSTFVIQTNSNYTRVNERSSKYANPHNDYISPLGMNCIKFERYLANRASNYKNLTCPYCDSKLPKELKRSSKCPFCSNKIHIRQSGIGLGLLYLTESEDNQLAKLRTKFYEDKESNPKYKI